MEKKTKALKKLKSKIEHGLRKFSDWSRKMIDDYGEDIKPQNDYSIAAIKRRARVANNGKKLDEKTESKLDDLSKKLQDANELVIKHEDIISKLKAAESFDRIKREVSTDASQQKRAMSKEELDDEYNDLIKQFVKLEQKKKKTD